MIEGPLGIGIMGIGKAVIDVQSRDVAGVGRVKHVERQDFIGVDGGNQQALRMPGIGIFLFLRGRRRQFLTDIGLTNRRLVHFPGKTAGGTTGKSNAVGFTKWHLDLRNRLGERRVAAIGEGIDHVAELVQQTNHAHAIMDMVSVLIGPWRDIRRHKHVQHLFHRLAFIFQLLVADDIKAEAIGLVGEDGAGGDGIGGIDGLAVVFGNIAVLAEGQLHGPAADVGFGETAQLDEFAVFFPFITIGSVEDFVNPDGAFFDG